MNRKQRRNGSGLLIFNAKITYARMLFTIFLGLMTTRIVFRELGELNYGLFAVLGASVFLITTIELTLMASTQRHLAIELGRNDMDAAEKILSTSVALTSILSLLIALFGLTISHWVVISLNVPEPRVASAVTVLRMTILSAAAMIATAPFMALLTASQEFLLLAVVALLFSILSFIGALLLAYLPGDSLANYGFIRCGAVSVASCVKVILALTTQSELRVRISNVSRQFLPPLLSYGGWAGLGALSWQLRLHGTQVIGNVFFGPSFNAALGIAQQVNGYAQTLPSTVVRVTNPMMTQLVGRDDLENTGLLRDAVSRICVLLTFVLVGPLLIDSDYALELWLGTPPMMAVTFVAIVLMNLACDNLAAGYAIMFAATGNIRRYSIFTFVNVVVQLALIYIMARATSLPAYSLLIVVVLGTLASQVFRVLYADRRPFRIAIGHWVRDTLIPTTTILLISFAVALLVFQILPHGLYRLLIVTVVHTVILSLLSWKFGLSELERTRLTDYATRLTQALARKLTAIRK
jgi:O-antigen/teichoic acid export membrane protein